MKSLNNRGLPCICCPDVYVYRSRPPNPRMTESADNRRRKVQELCEGGGLQVTFQTIATLHQCALFEGEAGSKGESLPSATLHWEILQYGIPVVIANSNGVVLCLADIETGEKVCEFHITASSQYVALDGHFHVLAVSCGCFGISFADTAAGEKLLALLKRVVPCIADAGEGLEPSSKVEAGEVEEGEEEEEEEEVGGEEEELGGDEVDFGLLHRRKSKEKRLRPTISDPKDFQHLSHVGADTAISYLTKSMNWTDTLKRKERIVSRVFSSDVPMYSREVDTMSTTSFMEFEAAGPPPPPPGPPPPPAPPPPDVAPPPAKIVLKKKGSTTEVSGSTDLRSSLAEELKRGVVLRPVGSGSDKSSISSNKSFDSLQEELKKGVVLRSTKTNGIMTLPMPPKRNQSEILLFEIKTFRRKKLHHVSVSSANMTDFSDDKTLESVMKKGLASMFKKLSALEISNVGTVTGSGEDTFDGLLE